MNNDVRNYRGEVIGFRCFTCGEVKDRMWGTVCNACRSREDEVSKLRAEVRRLTEAVTQLKAQK